MNIAAIHPSVMAMVTGVIDREGPFVNHPSDPGGSTTWGITERVARANGFRGDMRHLTKPQAAEIYYREYIVKPGFLAIAEIDLAVAEEVIDSGVNAGQKRAGLWLQQSLNVLNRRAVDYPDIAEDGVVGKGTISAFQALRRKRGPETARRLLLKCLNGLQFRHYFQLADGGTKFEDFMVGWVDSRIGALG